MKEVNGVWTKPLAPFADDVLEFEAIFTPEGEKVYFSSERPKPSGISTDGEIWFVEKTTAGLGQAKYMASEINDGWAMFVSQSTKKYWSIGAIYDILDRLERKGYVIAAHGNPTAERGGKSKRFYTVSKEGVAALHEVKNIQDIMWSGLPDPAID